MVMLEAGVPIIKLKKLLVGQNATKNLSSNFKSTTKFHGISKIIIIKKLLTLALEIN